MAKSGAMLARSGGRPSTSALIGNEFSVALELIEAGRLRQIRGTTAFRMCG